MFVACLKDVQSNFKVYLREMSENLSVFASSGLDEVQKVNED